MIYAPTIDTQQSSLSYESKEIQTIVFMVNLPYLPSSSCVLSSSTESDFGSSFVDSDDSTISSINDYGFYDFRDFIISHNSNSAAGSKDLINYNDLSQLEAATILKKFISDIVQNSRELPGEFAELVYKNFWDLVN